jgi:hypothetical protein
MKTVEYKRVDKPGTVSLCEMSFNKDATVTLKFGKKHGGSLKLPTDFIADAVEHYLNYVVEIGLKEFKNASKKGKFKRNNKS